MPAITLVNRSRLEGSGIIGGGGGGGGPGGGFGPVGMNGITGITGNKGSHAGMLAAARSAAGAKEAGAISARMVSGILYSINTGCFCPSGLQMMAMSSPAAGM